MSLPFHARYRALLVSAPFVISVIWWVAVHTADPPPPPERGAYAAPGPVSAERHLRKADAFETHACECEDPECVDGILTRLAGWASQHVHAGPTGNADKAFRAKLGKALECAAERPVGPPRGAGLTSAAPSPPKTPKKAAKDPKKPNPY